MRSILEDVAIESQVEGPFEATFYSSHWLESVLKINGKAFTVGRCRFLDRLQHDPEPTAKIYIKVCAYGLDATVLAQLDTGSPWSILEREIAETVGAFSITGVPVRIHTRLGTCSGQLVRIPLTVLADEGSSLHVEATVFVSRDWLANNFIGYSGLLERIRFALDPQNNYFYFGPPENS